MKKTLYLECYSGISGDMTVAALLDLGADRTALDAAVNSIKPLVSGFEVEVKRVQKSGIDACDFNVILDKAHETTIMTWVIFMGTAMSTKQSMNTVNAMIQTIIMNISG